MTIQLEGQTVTIISLHLPAPYIEIAQIAHGCLALPVITDYDASAPNREIDRLLAGIEKIDGPLIVMGDFNTSDREPHYAKLAAVCTMPFAKPTGALGSHSLIISAWAADVSFPLVRIDYVWSKGGVLPAAAHVECNNTGADHCFLVADLQVGTAETAKSLKAIWYFCLGRSLTFFISFFALRSEK